MDKGRIILPEAKMELTLRRLCYELREKHQDFSQSCLIGIQRTGVPLANRLAQTLETLVGSTVDTGKLDITFYRDDFRTRAKPIEASPTEMPFLVEGKRVVLVDDVLYTGRTIRAAMTALLHYGRPAQIELLTLIDRRFHRDVPIQADYVGRTVDTIEDAYVEVRWKTLHEEEGVWLYPHKA